MRNLRIRKNLICIGRRKVNWDSRRRGLNIQYLRIMGKDIRRAFLSVYQQNFPSQSGNKPFGSAPGKNDNTKREYLKFWRCREEYMLKHYRHRQLDNRRVYNIQEATKVNDVARRMK
jgi:hypothetical protein